MTLADADSEPDGEFIARMTPLFEGAPRFLARLAGAQDQALEGRRLCIDLIHQLREIAGVSGVHVMAYRQEETVAEVIERSGVLGGRVPWFPERDQQQQMERIAT